jgi:hypothetical protein
MRMRPTASTSARPRRSALLAAALAGAATVLLGAGGAAADDAPPSPVPPPEVLPAAAGTCPQQQTSAAYAGSVQRAIASKRDVWGEQLLAQPDGPTYDGARQFLAPLLYGQQRQYRPLTPSGVYYLAFSYPPSVFSPRQIALHVADGSEIINRNVRDGGLAIDVGPRGRDHYGACVAWLTPATLADGYLPIMQTGYVDRMGVRYRQESFLGRAGSKRMPVSFVKIEVDASGSSSGAVVSFRPKLRRPLTQAGDRLESAGGTRLIVGPGGTYDGQAFRFVVPAGQTAVVYAEWVLSPDHTFPGTVADARTYDAARADVARFWQKRLSEGAAISVPEERVQDALQAILVQQIGHVWRYSLGNAYEELSFAEGTGNAEVMSEYGYGEVAQAIVRFSLTRLPRRYTSWRAGAQLLASATTYQLTGNRKLFEQSTPTLTWAVKALAAHQITIGPKKGRLLPEALSSDQSAPVDNVTAQLVAWQGLYAIERVWAATGHPKLARRAGRLADSLGRALRPAVDRSLVQLPDGSVFLPYSLSGRSRPYDQISASRMGSYWNLVVPYAFATGFIQPGSPEAKGMITYLLGHGGRMLGVPRADAHIVYPNALEGKTFGLGQIYGLSSSRFLADNDEPDQLALSLYGMLAAGMTPDTYVSGEAVSILPLGRTYYRKMYMPPNSGANGAFLETLRLMLVHERRDATGRPTGLDLAFATPRPWLADGKTIAVQGMPTSFGRLSYSITRSGDAIAAHVTAPPGVTSLKLRLRVPAADTILSVQAGAAPVPFAADGTIDLSGRGPVIDVRVMLQPGSPPTPASP